MKMNRRRMNLFYEPFNLLTSCRSRFSIEGTVLSVNVTHRTKGCAVKHESFSCTTVAYE